MWWRVRAALSGGPGVAVVLGVGLAYLLAGGWLMANVSFDIWGALVAAPVIIMIALAVVRLTFRGDLAGLRTAASIGVLAKVAGTLARYWVANDVYGGLADSNAYHTAGTVLAGDLWSARKSIFEMIPHTEGTTFINQVTGLLYSFVGSSKLAGFLWFGLMGYLGVMFAVKAAALAVPGLDTTRYAWLCFLMPTLVFWPSAIGKEAWMSLTLGALTMGTAHVFRKGEFASALPWLAAGAVGAGMVRPHLAGIWLAALVVALAWSVLTGRLGGGQRFVMAVLTVVAVVGLVTMAKVALTYLNPGDETTGSTSQQVTTILDFTTRQTSQGGSGFTPMHISGASDYPVAVFRTLTRPLIWEVNSVQSLLPALEMTFLVGLMLVNWRRLAALPQQLRRSPYVLYACPICIMGGLVFATFGNLAILVRQRSLVMPMMLLLPCLPVRQPKVVEPAQPVRRARGSGPMILHRASAVWRVAHGHVLVNLVGGTTYDLRGDAAAVWLALDEPADADSVATRIRDAGLAADHVDSAVVDLLTKGLISQLDV